jgi:hypothetical protein
MWSVIYRSCRPSSVTEMLAFARERIKKEPSAFGLDDLDAPLRKRRRRFG